MVRIAIVEDEESMRKALAGHIERFFKERKAEYILEEFSDALKLLDKYSGDFDLIFMDVDMPYVNGIEASEKIREVDKSTMIIFVTNLIQYAVKGYRVNAFEYLVKPISYATFYMTMDRALPTLLSKEESILVTDNKRVIRKVFLRQLQYIEVVDHILKFHLDDETLESYDSLKKYETLLQDHGFALCNRCYLVNLHYVIGIDKNDVLVGKERLLISRPKRASFIQALNNYVSSGIGK